MSCNYCKLKKYIYIFTIIYTWKILFWQSKAQLYQIVLKWFSNLLLNQIVLKTILLLHKCHRVLNRHDTNSPAPHTRVCGGIAQLGLYACFTYKWKLSPLKPATSLIFKTYLQIKLKNGRLFLYVAMPYRDVLLNRHNLDSIELILSLGL